MPGYKDLYGITTALATPLTPDGQFDKHGMKRLVDFVLDAGINTLFALGVAGEVSTFDRDTRCSIIETVKEAAAGRAKVIAGVFDSSTPLVLQHIADAKERGADYALCTPPNFYKLSQPEMRNFFLEIAEKGGLPVIAYNCSWAKNHIDPETAYELADHPMMAGLKETSDMVTLQQMLLALKEREDFVLLSGEEYLYLPALAMGIRAFIMGGPGNLLPRWCVNIRREFQRGGIQQARELYLKMFSLLQRLYTMRIVDMAAIKSALETGGVIGCTMSKPFESATPQENEEIARLIAEYGVPFRTEKEETA